MACLRERSPRGSYFLRWKNVRGWTRKVRDILSPSVAMDSGLCFFAPLCLSVLEPLSKRSSCARKGYGQCFERSAAHTMLLPCARARTDEYGLPRFALEKQPRLRKRT